jgi:hypothetical protein
VFLVLFVKTLSAKPSSSLPDVGEVGNFLEEVLVGIFSKAPCVMEVCGNRFDNEIDKARGLEEQEIAMVIHPRLS